MKFRIGDSVKHREFGEGGIVNIISDIDEGEYGVAFDKENKGRFHSLDGVCGKGRGYWCLGRTLKLVKHGSINELDLWRSEFPDLYKYIKELMK